MMITDLQNLREERNQELETLRDGVRAVTSRFNADYWLERDDDGK